MGRERERVRNQVVTPHEVHGTKMGELMGFYQETLGSETIGFYNTFITILLVKMFQLPTPNNEVTACFGPQEL